MLKKTNLHTHLIAVTLFVLLPLIYCSPVLDGKTISATDKIQARGMQQEAKAYLQKTGEQALWTNSLFSGMPTFQVWISHPGNLFSFVNKVMQFKIPVPARHMFWYFLFFYILLLTFGIRPWLSIIGALAFGLGSYNLIILGEAHVTKARAIAYMPAVLAAIHLCFKRKYLLGAGLGAFVGALELQANHFQITYYLLITAAIYAIVQLIIAIRNQQHDHFWKPALILVVTALIAAMPLVPHLWTTYEYSQETIRGSKSPLNLDKSSSSGGLDKDYALRWSYGMGETFTLLIPNFYGGSSTGALDNNSNTYNALTDNGVPTSQAGQFIKRISLYWGPQPFTAGPVYFGAVICFLFIFGLFLVKGPYKWWLATAAGLSILLAWGRHFEWFTDIFFYYVPFYNKFRTVSMILVIASLAFPFLGVLGLKQVLDQKYNKQKILKVLRYTLFGLGGLCLFFVLFSSNLFDFSATSDARYKRVFGKAGQQLYNAFINGLQEDRANLLQYDAFRSLLFIIATFGVLWAFLKKKINATVLLAGLGILILVDMWGVGKRYFNNEDFVDPTQYETRLSPSMADRQILQDKGFKNDNFEEMRFNTHFRVFNTTVNPWTDAQTSYYHKSIGGYHAAKIRRYQELIEYQLSKHNQQVINMLNTEYFIVKSKNNQQPVAQRNPGALGNAWYVENYTIKDNAKQIMDALSNFQPAKTAIIHKEFKDYVKDLKLQHTDPQAKIDLLEEQYSPNELIYKTSSKTEGLAVFSEIYYDNNKGWNAYVDGEYVPHIRVNYVLRALRIPAGEHTIKFKLEPQSYYKGQKIAYVGSFLVLALFGFAIFWEGYKKYNVLREEDVEDQSS